MSDTSSLCLIFVSLPFHEARRFYTNFVNYNSVGLPNFSKIRKQPNNSFAEKTKKKPNNSQRIRSEKFLGSKIDEASLYYKYKTTEINTPCC